MSEWSLVFSLWSFAERDLSFATIWHLAHWRIGFRTPACGMRFFSGFQQTLIHSSIQFATLPVISKPPMAGEKSYDVSSYKLRITR